MRSRKRWLVGGLLSLGLLAATVGMAIATDEDDDSADQVPAGESRDQAEAAALGATGGGTITSVESGDEGAAFGVEVAGGAGGEVEVALDGSYGVIGTEQDDAGSDAADSDDLAPGADRDRAVEAALASTGGGTVTDVEVGDEGATYGVEILREDGTEVEVQIDGSFAVTGSEVDD